MNQQEYESVRDNMRLQVRPLANAGAARLGCRPRLLAEVQLSRCQLRAALRNPFRVCCLACSISIAHLDTARTSAV
jgi:hypothetical protein